MMKQIVELLKSINRLLLLGISPKVLFVNILVLLCLSVKAQKIDFALQDVNSNEPFHDGLARFVDNGFWGAIDTNGKVAIRAQFKSLGHFANGTAIAKTATGEGVVNRKGTFILEPKYKISNYTPDHPDVYTVSEKGHSDKKGVFYNGRLVIPIECSYIFDGYFPFISYIINGEEKVTNVQTGELFDKVLQYGDLFRCEKEGDNYYFTKDGEPVDKQKYSVSSKGVVPFKDQESNMYGFKNASTGQILIKPKYHLLLNDIWINDFMMAPVLGNGYDLISADGRIFLSGMDGYQTNGKYIEGKDRTNGIWRLYDLKGRKITEFKSTLTVNLGHPNWFRLNNDGKELVYDAGHNKSYFVKLVHYKDGIIEYDVEEGRFYVDAETGVQIAGPLKYGFGFHEGLAVVQRKDQEYKEVIDRNGKVYYCENENLRFQFKFSEGVLGVEEKESFIESYIYNPLGHKGYYYNQTSITNQTIARWNQLGHEAFDNKQYATAKDYFYKVMMNDPTNVSAVINYGAALGNMGYYDEAIESCRIAMDIDPDNQLAKDNLRINLDNKRIEEERRQTSEEDEREDKSTKSSTFWDALGNFANILSSVAGGTSVYQPYSSFSMDADYSSSYSNSGVSNHDYQSDYNRWANLAQRHYNSLTNLGYRVKHKDGSRNGGTLSSMSGSKYVQMKKSLRDAQHEMQRIRRKAAQNGVTITPSTWETATVGY